MIKSAADFTGALKVWMNNQVLFDLSSIKTRYVYTGQGAIISYIEQTGYGSGLTPTPAVHYVDDVTISLASMPLANRQVVQLLVPNGLDHGCDRRVALDR